MSTNANENAKDFADFISQSPSCYHAAHKAAERLEEAGFSYQDESCAWDVTPGGHYIIRDGAIIAYYVPDGATSLSPFRIIGAHTDSPGLKLKPNPDSTTPDGFAQLGVEVYGGALLNSWADRDLELAGRIVDTTGKTHLVRTGAIMRVPHLAIHLDRSANSEGIKLQPQKHIHPVWGVNEDCNILDFVAKKAGLEGSSSILSYDLISVDTQPAAFLGNSGKLMAGARMDNLVSVHAGLKAIIELAKDGGSADGSISVLAAFDHEEIGSSTRAGACGPVLEDVLKRTNLALGGNQEDLCRALAVSNCMSSDVGHSVHPNYAERHDPDTRPVMGSGPILKINANQRYTTDAPGTAIWRSALAQAGVEDQAFVSNNDMPCGSTIGPLTATRLGITTFDVGIPILSMHSVRELCHIDDLISLGLVMRAYLKADTANS
ncbi:M18 family aminopeptidase [Actinomycetaceae bacterium TAE3-ERU4]|nr:M18 family aminopeptidase [Actinomycetaceae bacterium TAE3-ERU4]